jgi:quinone-modifying oxidoreductase subunit QmoA
MGYPRQYVVDKAAATAEDLQKIQDACTFGAVDLDEAPRTLELEVGAVVWATGWRNYDVGKVTYLNYGTLPDVVTNLEFERLAAASGPTGGKLLRPSDGKEITSIAFVQCAGSRDTNHLSYCSGVCCLGSLKHIGYVREKAPNAKVYMFHIDVRAGKYEAFYERMKGEENVQIIKGKVAGIFPEGGRLRLQVEDIEAAKALKVDVDLAVLATGVVPNTDDMPMDVPRDAHGFLLLDLANQGIIPAGMVRKPTDVATCVQDATGAAMRAMTQE